MIPKGLKKKEVNQYSASKVGRLYVCKTSAGNGLDVFV
jgi:hypothetical protein